ncbi:MAG: transposase [Acidobacteriaceae bacterium]
MPYCQVFVRQNLTYMYLGIQESATLYWSLLKRGLAGVYHSVSAKYLQSYCDEYTFRYNRRFDTQPMLTSFLHQIQKALPDESLSEEQTQNPAA